MSSLDKDILLHRDMLTKALAANTPVYFSNMNRWFRQRSTKQEFDLEARKLLSPENIYLHNEFLLSIFNKLRIPSPPQKIRTVSEKSVLENSRKRKRSSQLPIELCSIEQTDFLRYLKETTIRNVQPDTEADINSQVTLSSRNCVQQLFLPDASFIMGRYLIGAWDVGLSYVENDVAEYVVMAVQILLRNILSTVTLKNKNFRATAEGSFYYDIGSPLWDPSMKNIVRYKLYDEPLDIDKEIASSNTTRGFADSILLSTCEDLNASSEELITLEGIQHSLLEQDMIPSHSICSRTYEKITQGLA